MPAKYESARAHSNPVMETRRRIRLAFALLLVAVAGLLTYGTLGTRLDRGELNLLDSQKALQQLNAIKEESNHKNPVAVVTNTKAARIVTCPACRLNSLPLVKKFVYELAPHFKPQLAVEWKVGYDPVLYLSENGKEVETVPLAKFSWEDIIHKLVSFGIKPQTHNALIADVIRKMESQKVDTQKVDTQKADTQV